VSAQKERQRTLTHAQLRHAEKAGWRITEWVSSNGRTYVNLVRSGRVRTMQVVGDPRAER
jgi:hypothetical protein